MTRDADGRRRVVFTDDERRVLDRAIKLLAREGFGTLVGCIGFGVTRGGSTGKLPDGSRACGETMLIVDAGTPDAGYRCSCSRIHFRRS